MDASLTLWIVVALVVCAVIFAAVALSRRAARPDVRPDGGDGMATKRPGLPGEPE